MNSRENDPRRGEIWWATMREPAGSVPGGRRPVMVVPSDEFNRIRTVLPAAVTGNVLVESVETGLPRDSVVNVTQLATLDKGFLGDRVGDRVGALGSRTMLAVEGGLRTALEL